jgi:hypothetical protein
MRPTYSWTCSFIRSSWEDRQRFMRDGIFPFDINAAEREVLMAS